MELCVNIEKTKIMIFCKGGRLSNNLDFKYAHRLLIETGRWVKPKPIALENVLHVI